MLKLKKTPFMRKKSFYGIFSLKTQFGSFMSITSKEKFTDFFKSTIILSIQNTHIENNSKNHLESLYPTK